jgi:hypothetical protein
MIDQRFSADHDREMAEKCRRALEKSLGCDIPLPNCMIKKEHKGRVGFLGRKNVQE